MTRPMPLAILALLLATHPAPAQRGRVVIDTVKSNSLKNLLGDPPATRVSTYLPPSYDQSPAKRYPVVYLLHGFTSNDIAAWGRGGYSVASLMDSLIGARAVGEMIIVMPNAFNRFGGTFYVNSVTNGKWEDFISRDLVKYADKKFRTLSKPGSRGIAGHSMGGFGAFYLSMTHGGDTYGAMYALSACCSHATPSIDPLQALARWDTIAAISSFEAFNRGSFFTKAYAALSAAFAPNPKRPPMFFSLAVTRQNGQQLVDRDVLVKFDAHSPLLMIHKARPRLLRMRGIAFDIGTGDQAVAPSEMASMDSALVRAEIPHRFETYPGGHTEKIRERLAMKALPFFSRTLVFERQTP